MKIINLLALLVISTFCCAMDESYASPEHSTDKEKRVRPPRDGSTDISDNDDMRKSPLSNQSSMDYGPLPSPSKGGSVKDITGDEEDFVILMVADERKVPSIEDIDFLTDPKQIAEYCNNIASKDCQDVVIQRQAELLAVKNLEMQEQLAHEEYSLKERVADLTMRVKRLTSMMDEIAAKLEGHKTEIEKCENCVTPDAFSVLRIKEHNERAIEDRMAELLQITDEIKEFERLKNTSVYELKKIESKILKLNQSLIRLRQSFTGHISKVAAVQAVKTVKGIEKKPKKFIDCTIQ